MPHRLLVLNRIETCWCAHPTQSIEYRFGDNGGERPDQFIEPEFPDIVGKPNIPRAGGHFGFSEF